MATLQFEDIPGKWRCGSDHLNVKVTSVSGPKDLVVYLYVCNVQVDLDGAPDAYGPPGKKCRDVLANARDQPDPKKKGWYGVYPLTPAEAHTNNAVIDTNPSLKDANGRFPVIQSADEPKPGFYVSQSSVAANVGFPKWDQRRYLDATKIAFGALSGKLADEGFALGDFCLSMRLDKGVQSSYPFKDSAGKASWALSEVSYKTFADLGGSGFTQHEINRANGFIACHLAFMNSAGTSVRSILDKLSQVDNPGDLPLMIACQLAARPSGSGLARLEQYQNASDMNRLKMSPPHEFHAVVAGLRQAGYGYMIPGDYAAGVSGNA
jgi:hypothetical protein